MATLRWSVFRQSNADSIGRGRNDRTIFQIYRMLFKDALTEWSLFR